MSDTRLHKRYVRVYIDTWSADAQEYGLRTVGDEAAELIYVHKDNCRFQNIGRGWHGTYNKETKTLQCD